VSEPKDFDRPASGTGTFVNGIGGLHDAGPVDAKLPRGGQQAPRVKRNGSLSESAKFKQASRSTVVVFFCAISVTGRSWAIISREVKRGIWSDANGTLKLVVRMEGDVCDRASAGAVLGSNVTRPAFRADLNELRPARVP